LKATLTFTLPDDRDEFQDALEGGKFKASAHEFGEWLRQQLKYEEGWTPTQREAIERVRIEFYACFEGLM